MIAGDDDYIGVTFADYPGRDTINAGDDGGWTALMLATWTRRAACVNALKAAGAK